ncbi:hypothetical protein ZOSMA_24G00370 [Zostera marina]|uniref:Vacuolar iron transporter n=1 Tax=Zostera marina TaxID=29655 RepID=A0A0K9PGC4_ZOSMR|nr:hypothetical protein ZOSMA_24G00370 [Zostera marina]
MHHPDKEFIPVYRVRRFHFIFSSALPRSSANIHFSQVLIGRSLCAYVSMTSPEVERASEPADLEMSLSQPGVDYANRANCFRATVVGANDGLVAVASFMIGFGDVNQTAKAMVVSGFAYLVAGACSAAIVEYISFWAQHDIQMVLINREEEEENSPNPIQAAGASAFSFVLGGLLPLLSGGFVNPWKIRVVVVCVVTSLGFGAIGGFLGAASVHRSAVTVFVGGVVRLGLAFYMEM